MGFNLDPGQKSNFHVNYGPRIREVPEETNNLKTKTQVLAGRVFCP